MTDKKITKACEYCGKEFEIYKCYDKTIKCCSSKCKYDNIKKKSRVLRVCLKCGKEYFGLKHTNKIFCSYDCRREYEKYIYISRECLFCHKTFELTLSDTKSKSHNKKYCTRECMAQHRKIIYCGENSPTWRGGCKQFRGKYWHIIRRMVYERDGYMCRECFDEVMDVIIHAHHIIPYNETKSNGFENLITLCRTCHKKVENDYRRMGLTHKMKRWIAINHKLYNDGATICGEEFDYDYLKTHGLKQAVEAGRKVIMIENRRDSEKDLCSDRKV